MKKDDKQLMELMIQKSQQSFLLALELYNKPTIKLNVEGFCIFICNAWELMLKAYLLSKGENIYYYKNKVNTNRTFDLNKLIRTVMTNSKDPARINMEVVIGVRNKASHLVVPEYAELLHDVFLACIRNYTAKLESLLGININDNFNSQFFSLAIPSSNNNINVIGKYGKTINNEFYNITKYLNETYKRNANEDGTVNEHFAIGHDLRFIRVKDKEEANLKIANFKDDEAHKVIKVVETVDASISYPLTFSKLIEAINAELARSKVTFTPYTLNGNTNFTSDALNLYIRVNKIKENKEYAYKHVTSTTSYTYSNKLIEKIVIDITNDPDLFVKYKEQIKKD